ncbi:hypothetical protein [Nonomuraea sp. NPDC003214]
MIRPSVVAACLFVPLTACTSASAPPSAAAPASASASVLPSPTAVDSERDAVALLGIGPTAADWPLNRTMYCLAISVDGEKTTGRVVK